GARQHARRRPGQHQRQRHHHERRRGRQGQAAADGDRHRHPFQRPHRQQLADADRRGLRAGAAADRHHRPAHRAGAHHPLAELPAPGRRRHRRHPAPRPVARPVARPGAGAGERQALAPRRDPAQQRRDRPRLAAGGPQHHPALGDRPHRGAARRRLGAVRLRRDRRRDQRDPEEGRQGRRRGSQRRPVLRRRRPAMAGFGQLRIPLGNDQGWLRLALESGNEDNTNRAGPDNRSPAWRALGVNFRQGDPWVHSNNVLLNTQYDITPNVQFYTFGHYGRRNSISPAFFRYGLNSPSPRSPLMASMYPDGFLPLENADSFDQSLVAGLRGTLDGWRWDVSANAGGNRVSYETQNSMNFAYFHDFGSSPAVFDDGILKANQQSFDIDIAKDLQVGWLPNAVTVAFGTEYLRQSYQISPGDLPSWYVGTSGTPGGAQGFAGWQPVNAVNAARHDVAE